METIRLACHSMATRFELVLHGDDAPRLRAAGEEAMREIERLNTKLSLYEPTGEIAHVNARAAREPVRVSRELIDLIQRSRQLSEETGGAFDITVAPLMRCWGFMRGTGSLPTPESIAEARACVGYDKVRVDENESTVRFATEGMMLDFGSIGKGYAVEVAVGCLRESGVISALLHGGTSTVVAIGTPPGADAWQIAIPHPLDAADQPSGWLATHNLAQSDLRIVTRIPLKDEALSVSAVWGKGFENKGRFYGHVIDPRTGEPTEGALLAAIVMDSATDTDAWSTAALITGRTAGRGRSLIARQSGRDLAFEGNGIEVAHAGT